MRAAPRLTAAEAVEQLAVSLKRGPQGDESAPRLCLLLHEQLRGELFGVPCVQWLATELVMAAPQWPADKELYRPLPTLAELYGEELLGSTDEEEERYEGRPSVHPFCVLACDLLLLHAEECETAVGAAVLMGPECDVAMLGAALRSLTATTARVELLASLGVVERIVGHLQTWSPAVAVDLTLLLVLIITRSVRVSSRALLSTFEACDGYSVIASAAVWLDKTGEDKDKVRLVHVLYRMLFMGPRRAGSDTSGNTSSNSIGSGSVSVSNPKAFRVLLWVMAEVRSERMVSTCWGLVEQVVQSSYPQLQEIEPFRLMFEHFDAISLSHRMLVLRTLRQSLQSSNLLLSELRALVNMIQSTFPSSVLIVCDFVRSILADKVIHASALLPARIIETLLRLLVPSNQLPCAGLLSMSPEELRLCLSVRFETGPETQDNEGDPAAVVQHCISRRVLALIWELVAKDIDAFAEFHQQGGVKRLLVLASECMPLRPDVFIILVGLISCDVSLRTELIPNLMEMLRDAGGTAAVDMPLLTLRTQVLDTLTSMFDIDADSRVLFREHGGFTWILAVLAGIGRALQGQKDEQELEVPFKFVVRLLEMLASCLASSPSNQEYLRNVIGISTLSDVLLSTGFFGNNRFLVQLIQSLLKLAVEGKWPPSAPIIMRNPDIIYVIVVLVVHHQSVIDGGVLVKVFAELNSIASQSFELHLLVAKRTLGVLLSQYVSRMDQLDEMLQREILALVRRLASFHVSPGEVKQLFQAMPSLVPPVFAELLSSLVVAQERPKDSLCFPWNSSAFLDFGPLAVSEWPFAPGFTISFWINIAGRRQGGDGSVHVCTFTSVSSSHPFYVAVTVNDEGRACLWSSTTDFFVFSSGDSLASNRWHHVVVSHAPANSTVKKKRQFGLCKIYVDGRLQGAGSLPYGPTYTTSTQVEVRFGSQNPGSSLWFLGNFLVFRDLVSDEKAAQLFAAGSSFVGSSEVKLQKWLLMTGTNVSVYNNNVVASSGAAPSSGSNSNNTSNVSLNASLIGIEEVQNVASALPVVASPLRSQNAIIRSHAPLSQSLASVGGIGAVLHLVHNACLSNSSVATAASIELLAAMIAASDHNVVDFARCNGWNVLSKILAFGECSCHKLCLEAVVKLPNTAALLDWRIWCRGSEDFQMLYFETLSRKLAVLGQSDAATLLSFFDVFENCPPGPLPAATKILFSRVLEPLMPAGDETVRALCDFILVANDRPEPRGSCDAHGRFAKNSHIRPSLSPQSLRKRSGNLTGAAVSGQRRRHYESRRAAQECCLDRLVDIAKDKPQLVQQHLPESFLVFLVRDLPVDGVFRLLKLHQPLSGVSWKLLLNAATEIGATEKSVSVLSEMMSGRAEAFSLRVGSIVQMQALGVLLRCFSGCHVNATLARTTVQQLHDAFLHNSVVRRQILAGSVVSAELCRVIASAALHNADEGSQRLLSDTCAFLREIVVRKVADQHLTVDSFALLGPVRDLASRLHLQYELSPLLLAQVLGHFLCAVLESFCADKAMPLGDLVRFATLALESWVACRDFALLNVRVEPWDNAMLGLFVALAPRIVDHENGAAFLSCLGRCCAQMIRTNELEDVVEKHLGTTEGMHVIAWLCNLPEAKMRMLAAIGSRSKAVSDGMAALLEKGMLSSVEKAVQVNVENEQDILNQELAWAAKWGSDLQALHDPQHGGGSGGMEKPSHSASSVKMDASAPPVMPAALMERQLALQKPAMLRLQQNSVNDSRALRSWKALERSLTHERGVWPLADSGVIKWSLDETEGPQRTRLRLAPKRPVAAVTKSMMEATLATSPHSFLNAALMLELKSGESIVHSCRCSVIHPYEKRPGELILTTGRTAFVDSAEADAEKESLEQSSFLRRRRKDNLVKKRRGKVELWPDDTIMDLQLRRYLLRDMAMELFLIDGCTFLIAFNTKEDRDKAYEMLSGRNLANRISYESDVVLRNTLLRVSITQKWQRGLISSFEYLQHLNTLAGRSYNDLTQYPVFPWVLADYSSPELDLNDPRSFRDLSKPMGAQVPSRLENFLEKYQALQDMGQTPYHYGSHYSNVGVVLHYLLRVEPFASFFLQFQGGHFDVADRLFDNVETTWRMASSGSSSDVKECLPEFYYLPDFLQNKNRFDLGKKQTGETVDSVHLPLWAKGSPRLFVKKMREALESDYAAKHLPAWIDLIFGCKQRGEEARLANNLFHPLTYEGAVNVDTIADPVERQAAIAQINSYGQVPRQLFLKPHPPRLHRPHVSQFLKDPASVTSSLLFVSSMSVGSLMLVHSSPVALRPRELMIFPECTHFLLWGEPDQCLRLCLLQTGRVVAELEQSRGDELLCAHTPSGGGVIAIAGSDRVVYVWRKEGGNKLSLAAILAAHEAPVTSVFVSDEFSILVSGSLDHSCIIWDLNRLRFIRSMQTLGPVSHVCVSPVNGDVLAVASASEEKRGTSVLWLYSVNGELLASAATSEHVTCAIFTCGMEGIARSYVTAGTHSGKLLVFDAFDLSLVTSRAGVGSSPITSLAMDDECVFLVSGSFDGKIQQWVCGSTGDIMSTNLGI